MLDQTQIESVSDCAAGMVILPPCDIADLVNFVAGTCPFSGHTDCRDCISNDFDLMCVELLVYADKFGLA